MKISYPESLPVSLRRGEIRAAMERHQVVIVCGDTGSGKTTQLPKIALEMGRGQNGLRIGCTQPRRIAATSVAARVAEELQVTLGNEVGYQIRFEDRTTRDLTAVKFMTDGILLAETRGDQMLRQYDTLIIDEAHERSLNIDFILGYLHRLLPKRRDLQVVISSATLDAHSFAEFFEDAAVVEVEGRAFPVEDVYQMPLGQYERLADQVARAAEGLAEVDPFGDTLVFLPGEREIRDVAKLLEGRQYPNTLVLPLFARQAGKEQQMVFKPVPGMRRIILATNVAETSLTIPDIRSVIDSGIARVNRFDPRSGIQKLQIEPISQASARQRRGRCGRVSEGICIRLYEEDDFEERQEFTDPEILRSNLAGVVLQMEHLGLGDPLDFPFVDKPQPKRITEAYRTLEEIGAIWKKGGERGLTEIGKILARLPLDPRVGRILIGADDENCLREGLIIASALTVQDPRERPQDKQEMANQAHAKFRDQRSDFTGWLRWWYAIEQARKTSNNSIRRFCKENFLNYRRLQEWISLHRELRSSLRDLRWKMPDAKVEMTNPDGTYSEPLHRAILSGMPSHIGYNQGKKLGYKGAGNRVFFLFPGSGVFGAAPAWVMGFEMVETAKLYAREVAVFDPGWMEKVAPHVCRYRYTNPHWVAEMGAVYGEESVLAFGLVVVDKRRIHFGRVDVKVARNIFIRDALVNGETRSPMLLLKKNRETILAAERLEHKLRRFGGLVHPDAVVEFYEERIPADMCTQKAFEKWASQLAPGAIDLTLDDCIVPQSEPVDPEGVPDELMSTDGESLFVLEYLHNPSEAADGITARIPLASLPHLPGWFGDWLVSGWLAEKVGTIFRLVNKDLRRLLPSNRDLVDHFVSSWEGFVPQCSLREAVSDFLSTEYGVTVGDFGIDYERLPAHLSMRYVIENEKGKVLGSGKDLGALQEKLLVEVQARFVDVKREVKFERTHLRRWSFGDLPEKVELDKHTAGFPGLHESAALRLWPCEVCAATQHRLGVAALYRIVEAGRIADLEKRIFAGTQQVAAPAMVKKAVPKAVDNFGSLAGAFGDLPVLRKADEPAVAVTPGKKVEAVRMLTRGELVLLGQVGTKPRRNRDDFVTVALMEVLGEPRVEVDWEAAVERARLELFDVAGRLCGVLGQILVCADSVGRLLETRERGYDESIADAREQFDQLLMPGWLLRGNLSRRLVEFRGLEMRLTRMFGSPPAKDLAKLERYLDSSAEVWEKEAACECGECFLAAGYVEQLERDGDLRLREFAPELRRG
jgi:ATP-dependent helicase HrpA